MGYRYHMEYIIDIYTVCFTFLDTFTGLTAVPALLAQLISVPTRQHTDQGLQTLAVLLHVFLWLLLLMLLRVARR